MLAGLYAFVLLASFALPPLPMWVAVPGIVVLFFLLIAAACFLFNQPAKRTPALNRTEQLTEWQQNGLLVEESYKALRAFAVEELEDEGSHYFLELEDYRVLFLTGQYLYEYEPDERSQQPRQFPCSEFTILRHRMKGFVAGVVCHGRVLNPGVPLPPFSEMEEIPNDGEIIGQKSFDQLKAERMSQASM